MKNASVIIVALSIMITVSCTQKKIENIHEKVIQDIEISTNSSNDTIPDYIKDLDTKKEITYFTYNGIKSETNGIFNFVYTDDPMWTLKYSDINEIEEIIKKTIFDKKTVKGIPDEGNGLVDIILTNDQLKNMSNFISEKKYREYIVGTDKEYRKLVDINFYDSTKKDYSKKVGTISVILNTGAIEISE